MQYNEKPSDQIAFQAEYLTPAPQAMPQGLIAAQQGQIYYTGPIGQPVMGQPYMAQGVQQPYQQQYQQVIYVQASPAFESNQQLVQAELDFKNARSWFNGCNCCLTVILVIILISRCVNSFGGNVNLTAGVFFILSILLWISALISASDSINRTNTMYFKYYFILIGCSLTCEIIADIISFATYTGDGTLSSIIITLIINILVYLLYIRRGQRMKQLVIDLLAKRAALAQQRN